MSEQFIITRHLISRILETVDAGLVNGVGQPIPGLMCVEAAICFALDLPHNDDPKCVDQAVRAAKIRLNDSRWSSTQARAKGLRRLAVLQLGTAHDFDTKHFIAELWKVAHEVAPIHARRYAAYATDAAADAYADVADAYAAYAYADAAADAAYAAADAAADVAYAYATDAADAYATDAAAYAAADAADAYAADKVLFAFARGFENALINMNVPGVQFLDMLDETERTES